MKHFVAFLVAATLAACATPEPAHGDLQKGAYRPPVRAPVFNPATDAPHTFRPGQPSPVQPGPRPPAVPHTPKTRSEPTIWASGGTGPRVDPEFLGVPVPCSYDRKDATKRDECARALQAGAEKLGHSKEMTKLPEQLRGCMVIEMFANCIQHESNAWWEHHRKVPTPETEREHILYDRLYNLSRWYAADACKGVKVPDHYWDIMGDIEAEAHSIIAKARSRRLQ